MRPESHDLDTHLLVLGGEQPEVIDQQRFSEL